MNFLHVECTRTALAAYPTTAYMSILVVDNYDSFTFNLAQLIEENGYICEVVKNDHLPSPIPDRFDKILISPGPGTPVAAGSVCELIRTFSGKKSILGICLGHQAIAEVFGGRLTHLANPAHGVGKLINITDSANYLFAGLPGEIVVGLYHSWTVSQNIFPDCLRVTAVAGDGTIMALAHREYDIQGIQFHPESVMTPHGHSLIHNWLSHQSP